MDSLGRVGGVVHVENCRTLETGRSRSKRAPGIAACVQATNCKAAEAASQWRPYCRRGTLCWPTEGCRCNGLAFHMVGRFYIGISN